LRESDEFVDWSQAKHLLEYGPNGDILKYHNLLEQRNTGEVLGVVIFAQKRRERWRVVFAPMEASLSNESAFQSVRITPESL
jgi:hypothetical protein